MAEGPEQFEVGAVSGHARMRGHWSEYTISPADRGTPFGAPATLIPHSDRSGFARSGERCPTTARARVPAISGSRAIGERVVSERVQKVLARAGVGSRRSVERWIADGEVRINGRRAEVGAAISAGDRVEVRGRRYWVVVDDRPRPRWLCYHKPAGRVTTRRDPEGRPTVFEQLPNVPEGKGRWVSLGRLDVATTGLMLFTDDGAAANALTHPSAGIEREYAVRVRGTVDDATLERLTEGIELEDGQAGFDRVVPVGGEGSNRWYHVVVREGRRNEVRRLWEAVGCQVARLSRVRFGPIELPRRLRAGRFEDLTRAEADVLNRLAGRGEGQCVLGLQPFRSASVKKEAARKKRITSKKQAAAKNKTAAKKQAAAQKKTAAKKTAAKENAAGATQPAAARKKAAK